jgi:hypothetical protein
MKRLLNIIDTLSALQTGEANVRMVQETYGRGFGQAMQEAADSGLLDSRAPNGRLKLSPAGRRLARNWPHPQIAGE